MSDWNKFKLNTWLGIGAKGGGFLGFFGAESTYGRLFSLYDTSYQADFSLTNARLGLGLGGSVGAVALLVFNCPNLWRINGDSASDWGVSFTMGKRWSEVATLIRHQRLLPVLAKLAKQVKYKQRVRALEDMEKLRNDLHQIYNLIDLGTMDNKPKVMSIEIPLSGKGFEISASYSFGGQIYIRG